jgi:TonB family protein
LPDINYSDILVFVKRYVPLLFLLCMPVALFAQKDTVAQKINRLPYVRVDTDPQFQGQSFEQYLTDHLHLRTYSKAIAYGNAILAMKIENDGTLSDVRLLKTLSPDVDKEIIRIVSTSPKWQPAVANHNPVGVYVVFNITVSAQGTVQAAPQKKQIHITPVATRSSAPAKPAAIKKYPPTEPEFPGGDDAFGRYLGANIVYPMSAKKNKIEGVVFLVFAINTDGSIGQIRIARSPSPDLSAEAIRVVKASPKWKPATENGKPIEGSHAVPINFKLQNNP